MATVSFPNHWLYEQVRQIDSGYDPQFALLSSLNWVRSLRFELDGEHGSDTQGAFDSCRAWFQQAFNPGSASGVPGEVYPSLLRSLTNAMSLRSLADSSGGALFLYPGAVIWWYYAYYGSVQAMLSSHGQGRGPDSHRSTMNAFEGLVRARLPHPLNMVAAWQQNEQYACTLPSYPQERSSSLIDPFSRNRQQARGMLLGYLSGTVQREVEEAKEDIKSKPPHFRDFRSKEARVARNRRLAKSLARIGFMHCAFRYRGKANYRDAIYIAYGQQHIKDDSFLDDLAVSARFSFVCALAYVDRMLGSRKTKEFLIDAKRNTRGLTLAPGEARSWVDLSI